MSEVIAGPDTKLAREATDVLREHGTELLLAHSLRAYWFGAIRRRHRGLTFDQELLYFEAVFHDLGLTAKYRGQDHRFEIDSANATRKFLRANGIDEAAVEVVWDAIAPHTTPEIPSHKRPEIALVTGGVEADALDDGLGEIPADDRDTVLAAYTRIDFKRGIVQAFSNGFAHKPVTNLRTMNSDLLEQTLSGYGGPNSCDFIAANPLGG